MFNNVYILIKLKAEWGRLCYVCVCIQNTFKYKNIYVNIDVYVEGVWLKYDIPKTCPLYEKIFFIIIIKKEVRTCSIYILVACYLSLFWFEKWENGNSFL